MRLQGMLAPTRRLLCTQRSVAVDTSGLIGRRVPHVHGAHAELPGLSRELASRIRFRGPLTVSEFMSAALTHPTHGYYMRRDVFGRQGDFVTSPEVSQVFGELLGIWCVASWHQLGKPERTHLVEAGPGRGTLIADILQATAPFPDFQRSIEVQLIEVSPYMRAAQRRTLQRRAGGPVESDDGGGADEAGGSDGDDAPPRNWSRSSVCEASALPSARERQACPCTQARDRIDRSRHEATR